MSATRHAKADVPLMDRQERYMSAPEFQELRGISGTAVATKVGYLVTDPRKRSLLLFLQGLSLQPGGLMENVVKPLLQSHAARLGSPTMHRVGMARPYKPEIAAEIHWELASANARGVRMLSEINSDSDSADIQKREASPAVLLQHCYQLAMNNLESFITELCINPNVPLLAAGEVPRGIRDCCADYYDEKTCQLTYFISTQHCLNFRRPMPHGSRVSS